jgi:hypothetical protein
MLGCHWASGHALDVSMDTDHLTREAKYRFFLSCDKEIITKCMGIYVIGLENVVIYLNPHVFYPSC